MKKILFVSGVARSGTSALVNVQKTTRRYALLREHGLELPVSVENG